jgi:hypothetical protein
MVNMNTTMKKLYSEKYPFKQNECPPEISLEMLLEEMKGPDTDLENVNKEYLWKCYYEVMFPPNIYGLTADLTKPDQIYYLKKVDKEP